MTSRATLAAILLFVALLAPRPAQACTAFQLGTLIAKGYDWSMGQGLVVINKRGVSKTALMIDPRETAAAWTSKYSSLTFNQYGVELPNGGMNDAGLVVEVLWLAETEAPARDRRPAINELEWIQYQLDNFSTVEEMIAHKDDVRVTIAYGKVHYFACDRRNACAAFENLSGELVVSHGDALPVRALTNNPYRDGLAFAQSRKKGDLPVGTGSKERFARAAGLVAADRGGDGVKNALAILESVRIPGRTQWQIVYEPERLTVHFRTSDHPALRSATLSDFDPQCSAPRVLLDLRGGTELAADPGDANAKLVARSLAGIAAKLPRGTGDRVAAHANAGTCKLSAP